MSETRIGDTSGDQWNEMAKIYKRLTEGTAHRPIGKMLECADALLPFSEATSILDNGCGPAPVMTTILENYKVPESCRLTCADFSEGMVNNVRQQKEERVEDHSDSPWSRIEAIVQDATDLKGIASSSQSHVTAGWVYFMTSDPQKCLSESKRVLQDGGVLVCSSWKGSQWLDLMNLLKEVRPDKIMPSIPEGWKEAGPMKAELEQAGFKDVESHEVDTRMEFEGMEQFVDFVLTKMPHMQMATKDMSEDEFKRVRTLMVEKGREMCSSEPGELTGTALVAVGRK